MRLPVKGEQDLAGAFETAAKAKAEALFVMDDGAMTEQRQRILELAAKQHLPVVSIYRDFANLRTHRVRAESRRRLSARRSLCRQTHKGRSSTVSSGRTAGQLLSAVNLKTAKTLGLSIPPSILVRADELIE